MSFEDIINWSKNNKIIIGVSILIVLIMFLNENDNSKDKTIKTDITSNIDNSHGKTTTSTKSSDLNIKTGDGSPVTIKIAPSNDSIKKEQKLSSINIKGKVINNRTKNIIKGAILYLPDYKEIDREFSNNYGEFKFISKKNDNEEYIRIIVEHNDYKRKLINPKIDNKNIYVEMLEKD